MSETLDAAAAVARAVFWDSGSREWIRCLSADGSRWSVEDPGESGNSAAAEAAGDAVRAAGADPAAVVLTRRAGSGRWSRTHVDALPDNPGGRLVVELTADELRAIAGGTQPPAVRQRITRALAAGVASPGRFDGELDRRLRVSTRGRHGAGGRVASMPVSPATPAAVPPLFRPNGSAYHPRPVCGSMDVEMIRTAHANGLSVLFHGPPGTGKTAALEAAFTDQTTREGLFRYVAGSSDTEVSDFIGTYVPDPTAPGGFRWVDGPALVAMEKGLPLIVDEVALIDPRVLSVLYSAMDGRRQLTVTTNPLRGVVDAREGFGIHGACNPDAPGAMMSEALLSRCAVQVEYLTDYGLAASLGTPARVIAAARNLEKKRLEGQLTWSPQMRELLAFVELSRLFGEEYALRNLIGSSPAMERAAVADVFQQMIGKELPPLRAEEGVR